MSGECKIVEINMKKNKKHPQKKWSGQLESGHKAKIKNNPVQNRTYGHPIITSSHTRHCCI